MAKKNFICSMNLDSFKNITLYLFFLVDKLQKNLF